MTRRGGERLDPRPCSHCGKVFRPRRAEYGRYCSVSCAGKAVGARQPIQHPPRACEWCGTTYKPRRAASRFCGLSCAGKGNLKGGAIRQNLDPRRRLLVQRGIILRPITPRRFDAVWR